MHVVRSSEGYRRQTTLTTIKFCAQKRTWLGALRPDGFVRFNYEMDHLLAMPELHH